jgi:hypothetical protein
MQRKEELKWDIDKETLKSPYCSKVIKHYEHARSQMTARTRNYEMYGLVAKNKTVHAFGTKNYEQFFSEGSTQYAMRKVLADTIQRVPDGELSSSFDTASKEHIWTQYIFDNKVMWSEFNGVDMMSNFTNTFKMSFIYGFAPVRTGFELDYDDDARISYNLENWADIFINPDCTDIRKAEVVYHRSYMSKDDVKALLDDNDNVIDSTYNEDAIKYVIDHKMFSAKYWESEKMADKLKGSTSIDSLMLITEYRKGSKEFVTMIPELNAEWRRVKNYHPRKDIPWNFFVIEPDPDFPLGLSQIEFLLSDQQFNDLFQSSAYKNILLAMEPPVMVSGWETNPSSYIFKPRAIWNLGNNPNQVKVEPVKIENGILGNWIQTREAVAASMLRSLNIMDGTVAKDAGSNYSKTAPGVQAQQESKTIQINQASKRMENFISDWASNALITYINSMTGEHKMTVDEDTRRRLFDIGEEASIIGDQITIDFDELDTKMINFQVRTGSMVERKEDQEMQKLSEMVQPFVQNLNGWSEENKAVIENEILLPAAKRMLELSDTDISNTLSSAIGTHMAEQMIADMEAKVSAQGQQIADTQQQVQNVQNVMPPEAQEQLAQMPQEGIPVPPELIPGEEVPAPLPPLPSNGDVTLPSSVPVLEEETAGNQVNNIQDLLNS